MSFSRSNFGKNCQRVISAPATFQTSALRFNHARYDGFGNLLTKGSYNGLPATTMSLGYDVTKNHVTSPSGFNYDPNGNLTASPTFSGQSFNLDNRTGSLEDGAYDLEGEPLFLGGSWRVYGLRGEIMGIMSVTFSQCQGYTYCTQYSQGGQEVWFGGRLIQTAGYTALIDRTGSVRGGEDGGAEYLPYGKTVQLSGPSSARHMFATYWRDTDGLDYAVNRHYDSVHGIFTSPDPYGGSMQPANPESFNRYAYSGGDPINHSDMSGLDDNICDPFDVFGDGCYSAPCSGIQGTVYTLVPNPDPLLIEPCWGAPVMPVQNTTSSGGTVPTCGVALSTRAVNLSLGIGSHSFLDVWNASGVETTLEGGPQPGVFLNPKLVSFVTPNGYHYADDAQAEPPLEDTISCSQAGATITDALDFTTNASYDFTGLAGPNSNSFLHWLIGVSGLSTLFPAAPPNSVGWYNSVYTTPPPPVRRAPTPPPVGRAPRPIRPL